MESQRIRHNLATKQQQKIDLPYDPTIWLLVIYPKKTKILIQKDTSPPIFIAALFTIVKTWEQPKCPLMNGWMDKENVIYIYIYIYMHVCVYIYIYIQTSFYSVWPKIETSTHGWKPLEGLPSRTSQRSTAWRDDEFSITGRVQALRNHLAGML